MRFLLSISISIWIAGGCLFGCTGKALAAEHEEQPVSASQSQSCHAAHEKTVAGNSNQPKGVPSFAPAPRGMTKDCPLVVNATAATSKNSGQLPDPGRAPVSSLPLIEKKIEQSNIPFVVEFLPNRGPTHLRCCVFLI